MSKTISILIADDHDSVRELLMYRLESQPDMKVVAHVGDAETAASTAISLKPDIVLMDIDMPGLSAFDAAERIGAGCPGTRIIFFTAFVRDRFIEQALAVQAWGYVTKTEQANTVIKAIRNVASGFAYFSPAVQARLVMGPKGPRLAQENQSLSATLTDREREVLCYIARGMAKKDIADTMCVSVKTVDYHCTNLMDKLKIHDRVELARFAIREGLIVP
ncbi:MAG: response regulator transcription factor [Phycisphaerae bacterium]|jgi:DNA-binding NarL/FixJ family response regulator|nr:response regulator transcription factor [Phycisphaerae bacterium]